MLSWHSHSKSKHSLTYHVISHVTLILYLIVYSLISTESVPYTIISSNPNATEPNQNLLFFQNGRTGKKDANFRCDSYNINLSRFWNIPRHIIWQSVGTITNSTKASIKVLSFTNSLSKLTVTRGFVQILRRICVCGVSRREFNHTDGSCWIYRARRCGRNTASMKAIHFMTIHWIGMISLIALVDHCSSDLLGDDPSAALVDPLTIFPVRFSGERIL